MNKTNIGSLAISNRFAKYAVAAGATLASAAVTHADIITWDLSGLSDDSRTLTGEDRRYLDINATSVEEVISGSFSYRTDFELHTYKGWNSGTKESSYNVSLDRMGNNNGGSYGGLGEGDMLDSSTPNLEPYFVFFTSINGNITTDNQFGPDYSGYLGVQFNISSDVHFGWIHYTMTDPNNAWIRINSLAYNEVAGEGIMMGQTVIPEPGAIALLATGAAGLLAWRNRRRAR